MKEKEREREKNTFSGYFQMMINYHLRKMIMSSRVFDQKKNIRI